MGDTASTALPASTAKQGDKARVRRHVVSLIWSDCVFLTNPPVSNPQLGTSFGIVSKTGYQMIRFIAFCFGVFML